MFQKDYLVSAGVEPKQFPTGVQAQPLGSFILQYAQEFPNAAYSVHSSAKAATWLQIIVFFLIRLIPIKHHFAAI